MKKFVAGIAVAGIALLTAGAVKAAPINFEYGVTVSTPNDPQAPVGFPTYLGPNVFELSSNGSGDSELRLRPESDLTGTLDASGLGTDITLFFPAFTSNNTDQGNPNIFNVPVTSYITVVDSASGQQSTFTMTGDLKAQVTVGQTNNQSFTITSGVPSGPVQIGNFYYYFLTLPPSGLYSGAGGAHMAPSFGNEGKTILHIQATPVPEPGTVAMLSGLTVPGVLLVIRRRKR